MAKKLVVQDVLFPIAYVSREAREVALKALQYGKTLASHNFIFYINIAWGDTRFILCPKNVYFKLPASLSGTPNASKEMVIPIQNRQICFTS